MPASAAAVGAVALLLYWSTLLAGLDLGDTGSLQATVGSALITPRDGYPLYLAIGNLFVWLSRSSPAHALNLASAVEASVACGLFVLVAKRLSGSLPAAVSAALLFATSYTFWSQSIIAEVYALHIAFVLLTLLLLLRWAERPSTVRLAMFFGAYALGFGDHLSMVLLMPGYAAFLLYAAPGGWRSMIRPRVVALAVALACLGAAQYLWNLHGLWMLPQPPHSIGAALQTFWFDVTKQDWRETMVMHVPESVIGDRLRMYWFDVSQQFGVIGPVLAAAGLAAIARTRPSVAMLVLVVYLVNVAFAFSYNVGDVHVFYLPSHLMIALLVAPGIRLIALNGADRRLTAVAATLLAMYAGTRGWRDYPAQDRSNDYRPSALFATLTSGLDDQHAILLADMNWQLANGLAYYAERERPEVAAVHMPDVLQYAPALIADNLVSGRDVAFTAGARRDLETAYGPLWVPEHDDRVTAPSLLEAVERVPRGTRFVLCVLTPTRDTPLDTSDLQRAVAYLTDGHAVVPAGSYAVIGGLTGTMLPGSAITIGSNLPFTRTVQIGGVPVEIRMESWLSADTIRRMGFGHVVAARVHTLIVERGVSFVAFDEHGRPLVTAYAGNIYAPQERFVIRGKK